MIRCGPVDGARFCHGEGCQLTAGDVGTLQKIARALSEAERTSFFPLDLPDCDARLLRLLAAGRNTSSMATSAVRLLGTRELGGGRSSARMYLVRPVGESRPMVIKLDGLGQLRDEVARYRQWIEPWEMMGTDARLHTHLGAAAIEYRLQASPDAVQEPAPTLEDRLLELRGAEVWKNQGLDAAERDLVTAVGRAINRIADLAARPAADQTGDQCWRHWPIENLAKAGVVINLASYCQPLKSVADTVTAAAAQVERLHNCAATHGDVHARNILLVDRTPVFVDFAQSGPGHPSHDLVCLDAAVRMHAMRMSGSEQELTRLYHELYVLGRSEAQLRGDLPAVFSSACSRVAISTACRARAAGVEVVEKYGGGLQDYLAMVVVISSYLIAHLTPQSGVERALLSAVGATFGRPPEHIARKRLAGP